MLGKLYVVATPIGNLEDITLRALRVLREVELIAAEDTRRTRVVLDHYQIATPLTSLYEHNEAQKAPELVRKLTTGLSLALVSEAGTPLISDPGYRLVQQALAQGIAIVPIPGACAAIAALTSAGLPTDRFVFEGFPPKRPGKRRRRLEELQRESRTLVFYESPRRVGALLMDMQAIWGDRRVVLTRDMHKADALLTIDDERCRPGDIETGNAKAMIDPVALDHRAVGVDQERDGEFMG
jgi:16S rRNA (cytidine1402-2'-O)-methyltransferase